MKIVTSVSAPAAQDARPLYRSRILHQEKELFQFSQGGPDLHPGGLFSDISVMAAVATVARRNPQLGPRISPQPERISAWGEDLPSAFLMRHQNQRWSRCTCVPDVDTPSVCLGWDMTPISQKHSDFWSKIGGECDCTRGSCCLSECCPWKSQRLRV